LGRIWVGDTLADGEVLGDADVLTGGDTLTGGDVLTSGGVLTDGDALTDSNVLTDGDVLIDASAAANLPFLSSSSALRNRPSADFLRELYLDMVSWGAGRSYARRGTVNRDGREKTTLAGEGAKRTRLGQLYSSVRW
jgi:hypothetical protein